MSKKESKARLEVDAAEDERLFPGMKGKKGNWHKFMRGEKSKSDDYLDYF